MAQLVIGSRVAIKAYQHFPRSWRYTQKRYSGKVGTIVEIEANPNPDADSKYLHAYKLDIDNGFHRWFIKDFSAINVSDDFAAAVNNPKPKPEFEVIEIPKNCPKCSSRELDFGENMDGVETQSMTEIHRVGFCDGCGANIILKYRFYAATVVPIK